MGGETGDYCFNAIKQTPTNVICFLLQEGAKFKENHWKQKTNFWGSDRKKQKRDRSQTGVEKNQCIFMWMDINTTEKPVFMQLLNAIKKLKKL